MTALRILTAIARCAAPGNRTLDDFIRDMGMICDMAREAVAKLEASLCDDCPPDDCPTDKMRCLPCPRRADPCPSVTHPTEARIGACSLDSRSY